MCPAHDARHCGESTISISPDSATAWRKVRPCWNIRMPERAMSMGECSEPPKWKAKIHHSKSCRSGWRGQRFDPSTLVWEA